MADFDISKFFGKSSFGMNSFNFGDYASIKNGSYGKLLKSYYSQNKDNTSSKNDVSKKKENLKNSDVSGLTRVKSQADQLKKTSDEIAKSDVFAQKDGKYDIDKITSSVKDFVNKYNDTIQMSDNAKAKDVSQQTSFMKSMTTTMSKSLEKVGITVGTDGKMKLDEESFKQADMKNVKALFSGSYSYASQISQKASAISSAALRSSSMYSSNGTLNSTISSMFNDWI